MLGAYQILDEERGLLTAVAREGVFSVDDAMFERHRIARYRERVWAALPAAFRASMTHDGVIARVAGWDPARRQLVLQAAQYLDQMVTNHVQAHDVEIDGRRVAALAKASGSWETFESSPLANTLGASAMLRTRDDRWAVTVRGAHLAYDPGKLGCSASGSVDWRSPEGWAGTEKLWLEHIVDECAEELGVRPGHAEITCLALARERRRLGKPQVFHLIESSMDARSVHDAFAKGSDDEHTELLLLDRNEAEALVEQPAYLGHEVSNELRQNLALALHRCA